MINWKMVIIGVILSIVLSIFFGSAAGAVGLYLGVIIAGIIVGYIVDIDIKNGATNGAIMGVIASIILIIVSIIIVLASGESLEALIALNVVAEFIISIILWVIFGAVGGAIGSLIRIRQMESMSRGTIGTGAMQSSEEMKPKIEFTRENISKCLCPQCPVQAESECAQTKMKMLQESMTGMSPEPSDVPGVYCATGIATCSDLDPNKMCNCPNCDVFKENNLAEGEPGGYFCQNGIAK